VFVRDEVPKLEDDEASHTIGGKGERVPQEREVNRRREVCEWEG
jgi:hypothetical protein